MQNFGFLNSNEFDVFKIMITPMMLWYRFFLAVVLMVIGIGHGLGEIIYKQPLFALDSLSPSLLSWSNCSMHICSHFRNSIVSNI